MKIQKTELVFILDRSGSMRGLESDTVGGFNTFIEKQKKGAGEVIITTILFNNHLSLIHDRMNIHALSPLTQKVYESVGSTALFDAIGYAIEKISNVQKMTYKTYKADKVIFVITTDGMENASQTYTAEMIKSLIQTKEQNDHWEFIFLGANLDAQKTAESFGIKKDNAVRYHNDASGIHLNYKNLDRTVSLIRKNQLIGKEWKKEIEDDYEKRK